MVWTRPAPAVPILAPTTPNRLRPRSGDGGTDCGAVSAGANRPDHGRSARSASPTAHPVGNGNRAVSAWCACVQPFDGRFPASAPAFSRCPRAPSRARRTGGASRRRPAGAPLGPVRADHDRRRTGGLALGGRCSGQVAVISGSLPVADAGRAVWLQVRQGRHTWATGRERRAAADGSFTITWRADRTGQLTLRVVSRPDGRRRRASSVTATPQVDACRCTPRSSRAGTAPASTATTRPAASADALHRRRRRPHAAVRHGRDADATTARR